MEFIKINSFTLFCYYELFANSRHSRKRVPVAAQGADGKKNYEKQKIIYNIDISAPLSGGIFPNSVWIYWT